MALEIESKWITRGQFSAEQLSALLADRVAMASPEECEQTDIYFDGSGQQLARAGLSLRLRECNGNKALQLKTIPLAADALFERSEINRPLEAGASLGSALKCILTESTGLVPASELVEQVRITNHRQVTPLSTDALQAELCFDHCVASGNGHSAAFTEMELERIDGSRTALQDLAAKLDQATGLERSIDSKYIRARHLLGMDVPVFGFTMPDFRPSDPAGRVVSEIAQQLWHAIESYHAGTLAGLDPEFLHKMRVSTRRLRSLLQTFAGLFHHPEASDLRSELKWLADHLGEIRDLDIRLQKMTSLSHQAVGNESDGWQHIVREICEQQALVRTRALVPALTSQRFGDIAPLAGRVFAHRTSGPAMGRACARAIKHLAQKLADAAQMAEQTGSASDIHRMRIQNKKLRYACELIAPACSNKFHVLLDKTELLHDQLGNFQDAIVTAAWARERLATALGNNEPAPIAAALGRVNGYCQASIALSQQSIAEQLDRGELPGQLRKMSRLAAAAR